MPERIQLSRAKGWRMPPNTVKVDRTTRWGNPFQASVFGIERCIALFENTVTGFWSPGLFAASEPDELVSKAYAVHPSAAEAHAVSFRALHPRRVARQELGVLGPSALEASPSSAARSRSRRPCLRASRTVGVASVTGAAPHPLMLPSSCTLQPFTLQAIADAMNVSEPHEKRASDSA